MHPARWLRLVLLLTLAVFGVATSSVAQLRRIPAEITPLVESDGVPAGGAVRVALKVALPDGFHVQSNKPRDPSLIPTELAVEAPAGIEVEELVFPKGQDFKQEGLPEPLLVFEREFVIGARLRLPAALPAGDVTVPVRLRYQACDDKMCYAPSNAQAAWPLKVVGTSSAVKPQHGEVFGAIAFGTGGSLAPRRRPPAAAPAPTPGGPDSGVARLDKFTVGAAPGGYLGTGDFLTFIRTRKPASWRKGCSKGGARSPSCSSSSSAALALNLTPCVLPMIPINLAIIGAGAQACSRKRGFLLGLTYGGAMAFVYGVLGLIVMLTASTFGTINASPWFNLGIAVLFVALGAGHVRRDRDRLLPLLGECRRAEAAARSSLAFTMGAVAALLAGACVAPVVIQVVLFASNLYATGTSASRWRSRSSSASAWRCRGRSPARGWLRCRSRGRGWSA